MKNSTIIKNFNEIEDSIFPIIDKLRKVKIPFYFFEGLMYYEKEKKYAALYLYDSDGYGVEEEYKMYIPTYAIDDLQELSKWVNHEIAEHKKYLAERKRKRMTAQKEYDLKELERLKKKYENG